MADEFEVGYGKPPTDRQFVKGHSGNPKGRPKGSKNIATTFHEITRELIHLKENGKGRTVTKLEAILYQLVNKALSGDLKAMKEILQWNQIFESAAQQDAIDSPDKEKNEAVMRSFIQKIAAQQKTQESASGTITGVLQDDNGNAA